MALVLISDVKNRLNCTVHGKDPNLISDLIISHWMGRILEACQLRRTSVVSVKCKCWVNMKNTEPLVVQTKLVKEWANLI